MMQAQKYQATHSSSNSAFSLKRFELKPSCPAQATNFLQSYAGVSTHPKFRGQYILSTVNGSQEDQALMAQGQMKISQSHGNMNCSSGMQTQL